MNTSQALQTPYDVERGKSLLARHRFVHLPSSPEAAQQILEQAGQSPICIRDLEGAIALDPTTAAHILKLANSLPLDRRSEALDLRSAMVRLGAGTAAQCALDYSLPADIEPTDTRSLILTGIWSRSHREALAGQALAGQLAPELMKQVYLCALLSHLGQLVLLETDTESYMKLVASHHWRDLAEAERSHYGYTHYMLGAEVLVDWNLPEPIWASIRRLDEQPESGDGDRRVSDLVAAGARVLSILDSGDVSAASRYLGKLGLGSISLDGPRLNKVLEEVQSAHRASTARKEDLASGEHHRQILVRAFDLRAELMLRVGSEIKQLVIQRNRLRTRLEELTALPPRVVRWAESIAYLAGVVGIFMAVASVVGMGAFLVMYVVKASLGIDLLQGTHLGDIFD